MGAEFLEFHSAGGIATVFHSGITGYPWGTFIGICPTLGTFQCNNDTNAFLACHNFCSELLGCVLTLTRSLLSSHIPLDLTKYFF
jgi:hypothetical protein